MIRSVISHIEYSPSKEVTFVRCKPEQSFTFKEGQFMMISSDFMHEGLGKPLKKPYSIATTNQELQEQGTIGFIVKKSREGYMSEYLTEKIAIGDILHLQGPVGHLVDSSDRSHYLLVSVGSGLSPMIGLYESIVAKQQPTTKVAMLYGERYLNQVLPSTLELFSKNLENSMCQLYLSREDDDFFEKNNRERPVSRKGYVQAGLDEAIDFLGDKNMSVFICGKPEMVDDVKSQLVTKGVDAANIKFEKY